MRKGTDKVMLNQDGINRESGPAIGFVPQGRTSTLPWPGTLPRVRGYRGSDFARAVLCSRSSTQK